jgi:flagellar protein FliO/FliZ
MPMTGVGVDWFRYAISIVVVFLLLIGLLWLLKSMKNIQKKSNSDKKIQVIETISIGPRQKISLIRVGSNQVLVGITPNQFTSLGSWSDVSQIKEDDFVA